MSLLNTAPAKPNFHSRRGGISARGMDGGMSRARRPLADFEARRKNTDDVLHHKPKGAGWTMAVIGHRGYGEGAPENSLRAFELALADPVVDAVEFDVQPTLDGALTVAHDSVRGKKLSEVDVPRLKDVFRVVLQPRPFQGVGAGFGAAGTAYLDLEIELKGQVGDSVKQRRDRDVALVHDTLDLFFDSSLEMQTVATGPMLALRLRLESLARMSVLASFSEHVRAEVLRKRAAWLSEFGIFCDPHAAWPTKVTEAFVLDERSMAIRYLAAHLGFVALEARPLPGFGFASYRGLAPHFFSGAWLAGLRGADQAPFKADAVCICSPFLSEAQVHTAHAHGIEVHAFFLGGGLRKLQRCLGRDEETATFAWLQSVGVSGVCVNHPELFREPAPPEAALGSGSFRNSLRISWCGGLTLLRGVLLATVLAGAGLVMGVNAARLRWRMALR